VVRNFKSPFIAVKARVLNSIKYTAFLRSINYNNYILLSKISEVDAPTIGNSYTSTLFWHTYMRSKCPVIENILILKL